MRDESNSLALLGLNTLRAEGIVSPGPYVAKMDDQTAVGSFENLADAISWLTKAKDDGALAKREDCADEQRLCVFPNRLGKQGLKLYDQRQQFGGQCWHNEDSRGKEIFRSLRGLPF